jgi:hypothetical protein
VHFFGVAKLRNSVKVASKKFSQYGVSLKSGGSISDFSAIYSERLTNNSRIFLSDIGLFLAG